MKWKIQFTATAKKNLIKIRKGDRATFARIKIAIDKLAIDPDSQGKKLGYKLQSYRSLRISNYRIIFEIFKSEIIIHVLLISHRKDVYQIISQMTDEK
jgi:mRNA interferase RelE/StbE